MEFTTETKDLIRLAITEDLGSGDITSAATISAEQTSAAIIIARENLVVCGQQVAAAVFSQIDPHLTYQPQAADGRVVADGETIATVSGLTRSILSGERTALNFLQRLSGIATFTRRLVDMVKEAAGAAPAPRLLDTRKTTPGWRQLEKYAVVAGGGTNHRRGLYDAFLIKNNHIDARGGDIQAAIAACRSYAAAGSRPRLQVEVRDDGELSAVLALCAAGQGPDAILLDNMSPERLREAVKTVRAESSAAHVELEASGGINAGNLAQYAVCGVDFISLGALTHSAPAADISLRHLRGGK